MGVMDPPDCQPAVASLGRRVGSVQRPAGRQGRGRAAGRGLDVLLSKGVTPVSTTHGVTAGERSIIEQQVAALLVKSGLHEKVSTPTAGRPQTITDVASEELKELQRKLIPPRQLFPSAPSGDSIIELLARDAEWAGEITAVATKLNAAEPQKVIDYLKTSPIDRWPASSQFWQKFWRKNQAASPGSDFAGSDRLCQVFEDVCALLREDVQHLRHELTICWGGSKRKREESETHDNSRRKKRCQPAPSLSTELGPDDAPGWHWSHPDSDIEIYTDSEEDSLAGAQNILGHPPFMRPLRRIIRFMRRREQLFLLCGKSLRVFDETQDREEVFRSNVNVIRNELLTSEKDAARRELRAQWRRWRASSQYAYSNFATTTSFNSRHRSRGGVDEKTGRSLKHYQVIAPDGAPSSLEFCLRMARYFAQNSRHGQRMGDSNACEQSPYSRSHWIFTPTSYAIPIERQGSAGPILRTRMCQPRQRFYCARLSSAWGFPIAPSYQFTALPSEVFFWLKRASGPLRPLHYWPHFRPRKQRPRVTALRFQKALADIEAGKKSEGATALKLEIAHATSESGESDTMANAMAISHDGLRGGGSLGFAGRGSTWGGGMAARVVTERDSSDSENDLRFRQKELEGGRTRQGGSAESNFFWGGYAHDNDVVRVGGVNRLRNAWSKQKRRRVGPELIPNVPERTPTGLPVSPEYSSSEESHCEYVQDQKSWRNKFRETRQLVRRQRESIAIFRRALRQGTTGENGKCDADQPKANLARRNREAEVLSSLHAHGLTPYETAFRHRHLEAAWPASAIRKYETEAATIQAAINGEADGKIALDARVEDALSSREKLGILEECWTHFVNRKKRVRGIEPRCDRGIAAQTPLGFTCMTRGPDGGQYQLSGIDQCELFRRFGDNKTFAGSLKSMADFQRSCREYYVMIDDEHQFATVYPASQLQLLWTRSAKQNFRDMHWRALQRFWVSGKYRRRFTQKHVRVLSQKAVGNFIWQDELQKVAQVQDKISTCCAFRKPKYIPPRTHTYLKRRHLDRRAAAFLKPDLWNAARERERKAASGEDSLSATEEDLELGVLIQRSHEAQKVVDRETDADDYEHWRAPTDIEVPGLPQAEGLKSLESIEADIAAAQEGLEESAPPFLGLALHRDNTCAPWAVSWSDAKQRFRKEYQEARAVIAEKMKAEAEFAAASKKMQQQPGGRRGGDATTVEFKSDTPSTLDRQLSSAVAVVDSQTGLCQTGKADSRDGTISSSCSIS